MFIPKIFFAAEMFDLVQERPFSASEFHKVLDYQTGTLRKMLFRSEEYGITIPVEIEELPNGLRFRIRGGTIAEETPRWRLMRIHVFPELMQTRVGDEGAYLLPSWSGALVDFRERPSCKNSDRFYMDQSEWEKLSNMNCCGIIGKEQSILAIAESGDYDCYAESEFNQNGINRLFLSFVFRRDPDAMFSVEDRSACYYNIPGHADYGDLAMLYRSHLLKNGVGLLADRMKNNPVLQYSASAMRVKIFMASKLPVADGNGPLTVHVSCEDACKIIDAMKNAGIEKAVITLVGWNYGGHDGAYPQRFPVEPAIGGEEGLRKLIEYAKKANYQIVPHDNATDIYRTSHEFGELVARRASGTPVGGGLWSGGLAFKSCPLAYIRRSGNDFDRVKKLGFQGHYYLDAQASAIFRCDAPNHPLNEKEFSLALAAITEIPRALYGAISIENPLAYSLPYIDESSILCPDATGSEWQNLPANFRALEPYFVPFYSIAVHGLILYQQRWVHHYADTRTSLLRELAFGARPSMEVSYRNNGGNGDDYQKSIEKIQEFSHLCFKELNLCSVPFQSFHEPIRGFYEAVYANQVRIEVNTTEQKHNGIPAKSYQITRKQVQTVGE